MRNFLTFVAVALITALMVALIAPPLIDWSARRDMVARAIAVRIGAPVRISGPIALRLLPTPYLEVGDFAIGSRRAPWLTGRAMRFELSLSSLFGIVALDDLAFDRPTLHLGPRLTAPDDARLAIGHIRAAHAEVEVARIGAAPILLHDVNFDGAATSLRGPWRVEGDLAFGADRARYRLVSDAFADDGLPLRGDIDAGATHAEIDGRLAFAETATFTGAATVDGAVAGPENRVWPWRIAGALTATGELASLADGHLRFGEEARAVEAGGRMTLHFGERPSLDADLKGKSFDLDALLRRNKETSITPARFAEWVATLSGQSPPLQQFSLKLQGDAAFLGARTLANPALTLAGAAGAPLAVTFASGLPGRGRVSLDGAWERGAAPIFRGRGQAEVGDFATLAAWIGGGAPKVSARLAALGAALPQGAISAAGDLEFSSEGYSVRGLKLAAAASRFDGGVVYRLPTAERRGRLYLDLASPGLDIDALPNVEAGLAWLGGADLDFRLQADTLRVARFGLASVSGGSLSVRAVKDNDTFALKQLSLADLGGASIEAEGEATPLARWLKVSLDAGKLGDFAALLARAAPGPATRWLQQRADDLGGAKATFEARRDGPPLQGPFGFDFLKSDGVVAGAKFSVTLAQAPAPVDAISAAATLDSPDAGALLRKLGFDTPTGPPAHAQLSLGGSGRWDRGFDANAKLALAGANLAWRGAFRPQSAAAWATGPLTLKSADLMPALSVLGWAAPSGAGGAADLTGDLEANPAGGSVRKLSGSLAGARLTGDLTYARSELEIAAELPPPAVTGEIGLDRASLAGLLALSLGRSAPGAVWPEAKFGAPLMTPPSLDVALKIDALDFGPDVGVGRSTTSRLQMDAARLALLDASTLLNGGKLSGRFDLRRGKAQATASGALNAEGVLIERAGARLDASLDFAGAGDSAATLIGSLAGSGRVKIVEAKVPRLDPEALARVYAKIEEAQTPPPDEKRLEALIGAELDKAPLPLAGREGPLALSSGSLHFGPLSGAEGAPAVSGAFDLTHLSLAIETTETYAKVGRYWSGAAPQIEIDERGVFAGPSRIVDAEFLAAGLAAESLARETDRIANFEADVRERAMFNRKRKAQAFLDRRQAEIAAYFDEQERRKLMDYYLGPYTAYAASRSEAPPAPTPPEGRPGKDAAGL